MTDPWPDQRFARTDEHRNLNVDLEPPTLVLLLAPSTPSPTGLLIQKLRTALLSIDPRAELRVITDHTRHAGSGFRLYGGWYRPADAHAALIFLFSTHLDQSEEDS